LAFNLALQGFLKDSKETMDHYKRKKFDADETVEEEKSQVINPRSMRNATKTMQGKSRLYTYGDLASGDIGAEDCYNLWTQAPENIKKH